MKRKGILMTILALFLVVGGGVGYYYWYQSANFIKTEDARVAGDLYRVLPRMSGKISSVDVKEGDAVLADQILGQLDRTTVPSNNLDLSLLRSPINGTVIKTLVRPGEVITVGQNAALVVDLKKLYVSANIEETEIDRLRVGEPVDITVDAFPGKELHGQISEIGHATNSTFSLIPAINTSGNFVKVTQRIPVKISINDSHEVDLYPGMNTAIKVHVNGN
ncbi:efflux RND transporter periplasmic adaptor subunit [Brevibacillus sp. SYSU BS000544]|uniref:efflux RND transporter periplasmic adaptor subunit n=1 Tax=Brevibacillus sp. SYSU BS000544 TaxID=3416443 RepID=UPI003CE5181C